MKHLYRINSNNFRIKPATPDKFFQHFHYFTLVKYLIKASFDANFGHLDQLN